MDMQGIVNMMSNIARDTRKDYHVCLGDLLERLRSCDDPNALVPYGEPHSYRGYYADLALEPLPEPIKVWELINQLSDVINTELTGYKGGEFLMGADTPVWISHYGNTGEALIDFDPKTLKFTTKNLEN